MAAARYLKARLSIGAALAASVIGGSVYFVQASPGSTTSEPLEVTAPVAPPPAATLPIVPASAGNTAAAPAAPTSAPVKPKATATAKRSRAS